MTTNTQPLFDRDCAEMSESHELHDTDQKRRFANDRHRENFESLKANYINQQEAHTNLQQEYATLSVQYEQLHTKSREIISTLQQERDQKITENEHLQTQVLTTQQLEQMKQEWMEKVKQHLRKKTEANQSEVESVRGEYKMLVCSYTYLKAEYESALVRYQGELQEIKAEHETELSSYAEKLRIAQEENDTVCRIHQIRKLQKHNSELEQRIQRIGCELEEMRTEHRKTVSENDKVIQEQSNNLINAQTRIESLEVECSTLSSSLESVQAELSSCRAKQLDLQTTVDQAHRETNRAKREFEEQEVKHKLQISDMEMKMSREYQESQDGLLKEKQAYEAQLELLQRTVHEYEALMASKEQEMEFQMQALQQSEWEKRVALEKENTVLEEKVATMERIQRTAENESRSQCLKLQDHVQELVTKNTTLEAELMSLTAELQQRNEKTQKAKMELQILQEVGYKKEYQNLLSQHQSLHQAKQELESSCVELQSQICALEHAVSDAGKEVLHVTETHRQTIDRERHSWQQEKAQLLGRLNEEEARVKSLMTAKEDAKSRLIKVQRHRKKKMSDLKNALELSQARQVELQTEKESLKKSLGFNNMKLKNELAKWKRTQDEFGLLLQNPRFCSDGLVQGHSVPQQGYWSQSLGEFHHSDHVASPITTE